MKTVIVDAYTDEPSGLGVPPYLGTYPRYLYGALKELNHEITYLTIDDLRAINSEKKHSRHTDIKTYNLTRNPIDSHKEILNSDQIIVNAGVQTPGKYLSAIPGTLNEIQKLIQNYNQPKILTGPVASMGSQLIGGKHAESFNRGFYSEIDFNYLGINEFKTIARIAPIGAELISQIPYPLMLELETGKGCSRVKGCSFCTEPIKNLVSYRKKDDILAEVKALYENGARNFRFGKQTSFYDYQRQNVEEIRCLLLETRKLAPQLKVLHIDNVDPIHVLRKGGDEITKIVSEYCTDGNVAAFGIETFDNSVFEQNNLNCPARIAVDAIEIINKFGKERGPNGLPKFLPGINIIYGLKGETKDTNNQNLLWLKKIMDKDLLLRRINIRQVTIFPGTDMEETGMKFVHKNKKRYWKWRNEIRQQIDLPMLKRLLPMGSILRNIRTEIHDGNTTFGRQIGTYPLIVGIKGKLELNKFIDVEITSHMLRSVVGRPII